MVNAENILDLSHDPLFLACQEGDKAKVTALLPQYAATAHPEDENDIVTEQIIHAMKNIKKDEHVLEVLEIFHIQFRTTDKNATNNRIHEALEFQSGRYKNIREIQKAKEAEENNTKLNTGAIAQAVFKSDFEAFQKETANLLKKLNNSTPNLAAELAKTKMPEAQNQTLLQYALAQPSPIGLTDKKIYARLFELLILNNELIAGDQNQDRLLLACQNNNKDMVKLLIPCYKKLSVHARDIVLPVKARIYAAIDAINTVEVLDCFIADVTQLNSITTPAWKMISSDNIRISKDDTRTKNLAAEIAEKIIDKRLMLNSKKEELNSKKENNNQSLIYITQALAYTTYKAKTNPYTTAALFTSAFMFLSIATLSACLAGENKGAHQFAHDCMKTMAKFLCGGCTENNHALGLDFFGISPDNTPHHKESVLLFTAGILSAGLTGVGMLVDFCRSKPKT